MWKCWSFLPLILSSSRESNGLALDWRTYRIKHGIAWIAVIELTGLIAKLRKALARGNSKFENKKAAAPISLQNQDLRIFTADWLLFKRVETQKRSWHYQLNFWVYSILHTKPRTWSNFALWLSDQLCQNIILFTFCSFYHSFYVITSRVACPWPESSCK